MGAAAQARTDLSRRNRHCRRRCPYSRRGASPRTEGKAAKIPEGRNKGSADAEGGTKGTADRRQGHPAADQAGRNARRRAKLADPVGQSGRGAAGFPGAGFQAQTRRQGAARESRRGKDAPPDPRRPDRQRTQNGGPGAQRRAGAPPTAEEDAHRAAAGAAANGAAPAAISTARRCRQARRRRGRDRFPGRQDGSVPAVTGSGPSPRAEGTVGRESGPARQGRSTLWPRSGAIAAADAALD